jgi:hypothetical protein
VRVRERERGERERKTKRERERERERESTYNVGVSCLFAVCSFLSFCWRSLCSKFCVSVFCKLVSWFFFVASWCQSLKIVYIYYYMCFGLILGFCFFFPACLWVACVSSFAVCQKLLFGHYLIGRSWGGVVLILGMPCFKAITQLGLHIATHY